MAGKTTLLLLVALCVVLIDVGVSNPVIDSASGFDFLGICIRNCAQCKKMYGSYFEGQMCADTCVKFKGKIIPDCEDIGSIAPFLNKLD